MRFALTWRRVFFCLATVFGCFAGLSVVSNVGSSREDTAQLEGLGPKTAKTVQSPSLTASIHLSNRSAQLLSLSSHFLPNYKNPCWKEPVEGASSLQETEPWLQQVTDGQKWRLRCLPYFYIAGIAKSGTTDLYKSLASHQDIAVARVKEPHWWARGRKTVPFEKYVDIFDKAAARIQKKEVNGYHPVITGEGSPSTLWDNRKWSLEEYNHNITNNFKYVNAHYLRAVQPNARIIATFRNPTDRCYSEYLHFVSGAGGKTSASRFHVLVKKALVEMEACLSSRTLKYCGYLEVAEGARLNVGMYYVFLKDWLDAFPRDQIYVNHFETYSENRSAEMAKIFQFLGVSQPSEKTVDVIESREISNLRPPSRRSKGPMMAETKVLLDEFFSKYNRMLADLLGDDRFLWR